MDQDLPLLSGEAIFRDNHGIQYHIVMSFTSCPSSLTLDKRPCNLHPQSSSLHTFKKFGERRVKVLKELWGDFGFVCEFEGEGRGRLGKKEKKKKKEWACRRNRGKWEGRALGGLLFFIIQNAPHLKELTYCIGRGFWRMLEGLYEFFKFNLCCYNIFKIKNKIITCINLSFSKKLLF